MVAGMHTVNFTGQKLVEELQICKWSWMHRNWSVHCNRQFHFNEQLKLERVYQHTHRWCQSYVWQLMWNGLRSLTQQSAPIVEKWTHCMIGSELSSWHTVEVVTKFINFIKTRPLKSRVFDKLCRDDCWAPKSAILLLSQVAFAGNMLWTSLRTDGLTSSFSQQEKN